MVHADQASVEFVVVGRLWLEMAIVQGAQALETGAWTELREGDLVEFIEACW